VYELKLAKEITCWPSCIKYILVEDCANQVGQSILHASRYQNYPRPEWCVSLSWLWKKSKSKWK